MKEDEDVQKADLEHCGLFLSWLRLLRTVCKQCTNYFQAAQPHRTTCLNSSPADSHPLKESLFQDVFDVQSFKCEIEFPLGFLSSCASGSPLCALVAHRWIVPIAGLSHGSAAELSVCKLSG